MLACTLTLEVVVRRRSLWRLHALILVICWCRLLGFMIFTETPFSHLQIRLAHADLEIRLAQDPFPLFPGEVLKTTPSPLRIVAADSALRLKAVLDFDDAADQKRVAGDEWLFEGPGQNILTTFTLNSFQPWGLDPLR